jgi:catechol 2,3-dioxygenase-like lactoylglutathione lyase family enzyme
MLDHVSLRVVDYDRALEFYKAALAPIGYSLIMEFPGFAGLGEKGKPDLWITRTDKTVNPTHVAFRADRKLVDAFHAAAVAAGGTDDGAPGPRDYHPNYYGGFVLDPEGNHIEVCCHEPPGGALGAAAERLRAAGRKLKAAVQRKPSATKAKAQVAAAASKAKTAVTQQAKSAAGKAKAAAGKAKAAAGKAKAAAGKAKAASERPVAAVKKAAGQVATRAKAVTRPKARAKKK